MPIIDEWQWDWDFISRPLLILLGVIIVLLICIISLIFAGLVEAIRAVPQLKVWLLRHPLTLAVSATLLVIGIGAVASYWKRKALMSYGVIEIAFGAAVSFNILRSGGNVFSFAKLFAIGSSVYVVARGFNNLTDAYKTRRVTSPS
jgi:hypothetical protein